MNLKWILGASVALNAALLIALQLKRPTSPTEAEPLSTDPATSLGLSGAVGLQPDFGPSERIGRKKAKTATAAEGLETDDYPAFVRQLRAAGLSEETIGTLVVAELRDRSIDDSLALQRKWSRGELTQEEYQKQQRQLGKDQEATLEALLGKKGYRRYQIDHDYQLRQLALNSNLSSKTLEKYFDLRKASQDKLNELADKFPPGGGDYQDKVAAQQKAFQDELVKALGSNTVATINAETSWQVQNMRRQLQAVKVSDDEYAQIGQIFQNYQQEQQRLSAMQQRGDVSGQDLGPQYQALAQQQKDQLSALLGSDRYAEYEKQNDSTYQQMKQWAKPNGLSDAQADYLYQVIKNWRSQQQDLYKQLQAKQLQGADYNAAVEQASVDVKNTLQRYLGADQYNRLKNATGQVP